MNDRVWPDKSSEWSQDDLHAYVRQMGINPDPTEIVPQGVKWIEWPLPQMTEQEMEHVREISPPRGQMENNAQNDSTASSH